MMFREMMHMGPHSSPAIGLLVVASMFKDTLPWVYEVGLDAYRELKNGYTPKAQQSVDEFKKMIEFMMHGPWGREISGRSKEMMFMMEEIEPTLDRIAKMIAEDAPRSRRRMPQPKKNEDA